MKIVVFAPHPDDEIMGSGGSILKWIEEGHEVHIIYLTDNRALFREGHVGDQLIEDQAQKYINLEEESLAQIALEEAKKAAKAFGVKDKNTYIFKFPDMELKEYVEEALIKTKKIIRDSNRIVIPSHNNPHPDHQATHDIAKKALKELNLESAEILVYSIYVGLQVPRDKQKKIKIKEYRDQLFEIMKLYETQLCFVDTNAGWQYLKRKRYERFGKFSLGEAGKFFNF